jgi:hypothetical protein
VPYKGLDALKAKITDPVIRKWADTLKAQSRTKLFTLLQFWDWASEVIAKDPKTEEEKVRYWKSGEELLADYDRCASSSFLSNSATSFLFSVSCSASRTFSLAFF